MATKEPNKVKTTLFEENRVINSIVSQKSPSLLTNREIRELARGQVGRFALENEISGEVEITLKDIKNITWETGKDNNLKDIRPFLIRNLRNIIDSGEYIGWGTPDEGTHQGTLYFAYFSKDIGQRVYLALKRQKNSPLLKPHIFYSEDGFKIRKGKIIKGTPTL